MGTTKWLDLERRMVPIVGLRLIADLPAPRDSHLALAVLPVSDNSKEKELQWRLPVRK